jgi:hypothetical protein
MKRSRLLTAFVLVAALAGCSHKSHDTSSPPAPTASGVGATSTGPTASGGGAGQSAPPTSPTPTTESTKSSDGTVGACDGGTIAFGEVVKPYTLTRVSLPFTVYTGKTPRRPAMSAVTTVSADVKAGPQVPDMTVYRAFAAKVGVDPDVVLLGEVYDGSTDQVRVSTLTAGRYVAYNGVRSAQSTFTYTCGGQPYEGFVSVFLSSEAGTVKCGKSLPSTVKADGAAAYKRCG